MDNILPTETFTEVDGRRYLNPQIALDESNAFIDNLRATQAQQNQQIAQQTHNLGTDVPSNLGGLTGGEGYFTSRYQTPQTNTNVANLRATAQASAMKQALANEESMWKKRYQDAYRAYQKSAYDKANQPNNPTNNPTGDPLKDGEVETIITEDEQGSSSPVGSTDFNYSSWGDFVAGKGAETISYTINGKTYYANVYRQTGYADDRSVGIDTSTGMSYEGQHALDYLNKIISDGGTIKDQNGNEVTPYQALTGSTGR